MRDPNAEWAAITSEYLHILPHPEWGWWAMRGQLVESPGYMMNYAIGAMVTAELRARAAGTRPFYRPDKKMYDWLSDHLYQLRPLAPHAGRLARLRGPSAHRRRPGGRHAVPVLA
ncbi:MAG: hypothetical protein IPF98_04770 [Gemmatimonadetes bacterium]|nr:hypothetical protein [Gemmatimonadota bacterium]